MEILMLVLLYYLSQNPNFAESMKPLMGQLKNSEQMLGFLNELSQFTQTFSAFQNQKKKEDPAPKDHPEKKEEKEEKKEKEPQSPTSGIADDFIQQILEGYLKKY